MRALALGTAIGLGLSLAGCSQDIEQRAATGGMSGVAAGSVVGGPGGAVVGGLGATTAGAAMDEGVDEKVKDATE